MDQDRVEGTARNVGGKMQEGVGRMTGDARLRAEGLANQTVGTAQDLYGQAADSAREQATNLDRWLRRNIETQPYTCALVALDKGWLFGRNTGRFNPHAVGRRTSNAPRE